MKTAHAATLGLCALFLSISPAPAALLQVFQQTGNLGVEVTGVAGGNMPIASGTLTLSSLPPTATVLRATLLADQTNQFTGLDAAFGGAALNGGLPVGPSASDAAFNTLYTYSWDVTSMIFAGMNSYSFTIGQNTLSPSNIAGVALSVVWSDPTEQFGTVTVIEGMKQVGESGPETETVTLTGQPAGPTDVSLFTVFDDNTHSGETVTYNGATVATNIDQNLGFNASLFQNLSGNSSLGTNNISITTGQDQMAWMVAATKVVPEPSRIILMLLGFTAALVTRRRRT